METTRKIPAEGPPKENADFARHLQALLVRRCQANPAYSLRAFAKQLGLEPSFLSKVLAGKRKVTLQLIERLAAPLSLSPLEVREFKNELANATTTTGKKTEFTDLTVDAFQVIADWYHYAILELTKVKGFKLSPAWIAKRLGISVHEARDAIERLQRLEMLEVDAKTKRLVPVKNFATTSNPFTAPAFRKLQKQILLQALHALENVPFEKRHQSSLTLAVHGPNLKKAIEKIGAFREELSDVLQPAGKVYEDVYQLSISLFPTQNPGLGVSHEN